MEMAQTDPDLGAGDEAPSNGLKQSNMGALDRRLAADTAIFRRRRIALDFANSAAFQERWGQQTAHINTGGTGWRLPGQ